MSSRCIGTVWTVTLFLLLCFAQFVAARQYTDEDVMSIWSSVFSPIDQADVVKPLKFSGGNSAVLAHSDHLALSESLSISVWCRQEQRSNAARLVEKGEAWTLFIEQNGAIKFGIANASLKGGPRNVGRIYVRTQERIPLGEWVHVQATYESSDPTHTARIFINGQEATSYTQYEQFHPEDDHQLLVVPDPLYIGNRREMDRGFIGEIGAVYIGPCEKGELSVPESDPFQTVGSVMPGQPLHSLQTNAAFMAFDTAGNIVTLAIDGQPVSLAAVPSGFLLHDINTDMKYQAPGRWHQENGALVYQGVLSEAMLQIEATFSPQDDGSILVDGMVEDLSGRERAIDVVFSLPVALKEAIWQPSIITQHLIGSESEPIFQDTLPVSALALPNANAGVAFNIPPTHPCRFQIGVHPDSNHYYIRMRYGLSSAAGGHLRSRAPFRFEIDFFNNQWGIRAALQRYYQRYPLQFTTRVEKYGFWQTSNLRNYIKPEYYAFHEGGNSKGAAVTVAQYSHNDGWHLDEEYGIYTLPYVIVGQGEIEDLPRLPQTYDEAMAYFTSWRHYPELFSSPGQPNSYQHAEHHKEVIRNSALFTADGRYVIELRNRNWGGNMVTFVLNPNPALCKDDVPPKRTIAGYVLDEYISMLMADSDYIDGIYVDSLGHWGDFYNYRQTILLQRKFH